MDTIRNQVELGQLDTALEMAGRAIVESGNPRLIKALNDSRPLDCDWTQVVAAAIEADFDAKAAGREGCRDILLQLSAFPEDRTVFTSGFFGPRPPQSDSDRLEHGQRAPSRVGRSEAIDVPGLAALAALESDAGLSGQQRIEQERLAGTLLVLRFLETIRRYAADVGFPFPVTLRAGVESVGGEDAIRQLSPRLHMDLPSRVAPIGADVVQRLADRYAQHGEAWRIDCRDRVAVLRESFAERGRVESMLIPHDMPEHRYYEDLENRLVMYEPENRVSPEQFAKLAAKVAEHRERAGPRPVDPAPYL